MTGEQDTRISGWRAAAYVGAIVGAAYASNIAIRLTTADWEKYALERLRKQIPVQKAVMEEAHTLYEAALKHHARGLRPLEEMIGKEYRLQEGKLADLKEREGSLKREIIDQRFKAFFVL